MQPGPVNAREPGRLHVFISHTWSRDSLYRVFVSMLHRSFGQRLCNLSIPASDAQSLMSIGSRALAEECALQRRHIVTAIAARDASLQALERHKADAAESMATLTTNERVIEDRLKCLELETRACTEEQRRLERLMRIESSIELSEQRIALGKPHLGERQLASEMAWLTELKESRLQRDDQHTGEALRATSLRLDEIFAERSSLLIERREVEVSRRRLEEGTTAMQRVVDVHEHEVTSRAERVQFLESGQDPSTYNEFQHMNVLMRKLPTPEIARKHPNLALEIYDRVRRSDVVFFLMGAYDVYREWMEFEAALVTDMAKIAIAVVPPNEYRLTPHIEKYVHRNVVHWRENECATQEQVQELVSGCIVGYDLDVIP